MGTIVKHEHETALLRVGSVAAIVGTVLQVAAGTSQSAVLRTSAEVTLPSLAGQPGWLWPVVYLAFIFGAMLWVGALVALATTLREGASWALGRLAVAAVIVGAALHAVDASLNAGGLTSLARAWAAAAEVERAPLVQNGDLLLRILDGTWAGVITLFHGLPFTLAGLAVALSHRYPAWLGWIGFVGGAGSLIVGVAMFLGLAPAGLAVPFAVILSLFMVVLGWMMWPQAAGAPQAAARGSAP
jgi:Domain of unknown function (DUF4386)